jgi:hypothetical protein
MHPIVRILADVPASLAPFSAPARATDIRSCRRSIGSEWPAWARADPWILAVVDTQPSDRSEAPDGIPLGTGGMPSPVLVTLDVDGERFAIRQGADGGTDYDWLSGPNKDYGFSSSAAPNACSCRHRQL